MLTYMYVMLTDNKTLSLSEKRPSGKVVWFVFRVGCGRECMKRHILAAVSSLSRLVRARCRPTVCSL